MKPRVSQLGQSGATTGQGLVWNGTEWAPAALGSSGIPATLLDAKGDLIVASAADTAARLPVGTTTGHVLTVDPLEALGVKWAAAPGGGSAHAVQDEGVALTQRATLNFAGTGVTVTDDAVNLKTLVTIPGAGASSNADGLYSPLPGETTIDEFSDATIDPEWVLVQPAGGAARSVWAEAGHVMSVKQEGGDTLNVYHALLRPIGTAPAVGDAWSTCVTFTGTAVEVVTGIILSDSAVHGAGNQIGVRIRLITNPTTLQIAPMGLAGFTSNAVPVVASTYRNSPIFVRFVMVAAGTWRADFSCDGVSWVLGPNASLSIAAPTHVGLVQSSLGTATKASISYEFFRRAAGVS